MSKFQLGLTIVFGFFIVIGVAVFALSKGTTSNTPVVLTVWGPLPQSTFTSLMSASGLSGNRNLTITYVQKNPATFENDFVNALANGQGPDVVMISQDQLYQNENKLLLIPYTDYSERTFKDDFVQEGEIFLTSTGMYALPVMIDPMVMYWNRDIFNTAGIAKPPAYWDEVLILPKQLTKIDASGNIIQSAVAFGEWSNVVNAKAILSNLLLQAGDPVVDNSSGTPTSGLSDNPNNAVVSPALSAINFYTQFANPTSATYSWNRSEPNSLTDFLSGDLALYFGFASELTSIRAKNPNLNFDVAAMPQARPVAGTANVQPAVFANVYGLAIVKQSKNPAAAFQAITTLSGDPTLAQLAALVNLPPPSRSLLSSLPTDPYQNIFYRSALIAKGWLDPNPQSSAQIFENMIESITSGQADVSTAITAADQKISLLLQQ